MEVSGVVGSVVYEASVLGGLSEDDELIGWELSREVAVVSGEVGRGRSMVGSCQGRKLSCLVR